MTTTRTLPPALHEAVGRLIDQGLMACAEDGSLHIVPTDLAGVLDVLRILGAARAGRDAIQEEEG
jgi:hypothetical protein